MAASDKSNRRIFRLFRRGARYTAGAGKSLLDDGALWAAHQRASSSIREAGEAAQRIASQIAKQRSAVDALADRARGVSTRSAEVSLGFTRLTDAFERLELVALNAGLEGARFGEGPGQALGLVSDEIRAQARRGSELCRELRTALGEIGTELAQVHTGVDAAREAAADVGQEAARVGGAAAQAERALIETGDRLKRTTGTDPETARAVADVAEQAKALVAALGSLSGRAPQDLVLAAMRPALEPIIRLLDGEDEPE
jgi:methyl-accepting chemotaxis protein